MADLKRGLIRLNPDREPPRRRVLAAGAVVAGAGVVGPAASGAVTPRRPDQADMPAPRGLGGGFRGNLFKGRLVIIFGPTGEPLGVFLYAAGTTPALGNPPIAWISNATADPFGNPLSHAGIVSQNNATNQFSQLLAGQLTLGSGVAASVPGSLVAAVAGEIVIDSGAVAGGDSDALVRFFSKNAGGLSLPLLSLDVQTALNNAGGGAVLVINNSGMFGNLPLTKTDISTNTNANLVGAQPLTVAWTINANDAKAATVYEVEVSSNGIFENQSLGFVPSLNGAAVATSGGDTLGGAFFGLGVAFNGTVKLKVQILTTGAGGTANFFITGGMGINGNRSSGTNNNNAYLSSQATGVAFNTTVANTIGIDSVWGGSTAGQTVTGHGSDFTRKGP